MDVYEPIQPCQQVKGKTLPGKFLNFYFQCNQVLCPTAIRHCISIIVYSVIIRDPLKFPMCRAGMNFSQNIFAKPVLQAFVCCDLSICFLGTDTCGIYVVVLLVHLV